MKDKLNQILIKVLNIILGLFLLLSILNVFAIFKFKKHKKYQYMRYFNHFVWIILGVLTIFTFFLGAVIGSIGIFSKDAVPIINFILGEDNLKHDRLIIEDKLMSETMNICLYHGGDLASEFFGLQNTEVDYLNQLYTNKDIIKIMGSMNKDNFKNSIKVDEFSASLQNISKDILLISENANIVNSPKNLIKKLNEWTDSTYTDNKIKSCTNPSKDRWVVNKKDCPNGYIYTSPSDTINFSQRCLVILEWSESSVKIRYQNTPSECLDIDQNINILNDKIYFYWKALDNISNQNQILITRMLNKLSLIKTKYTSVANLAISNNEKIINYASNLSKKLDKYLSSGKDFYNLIDCSHLKYDLYVLYSNLKDNLSSDSVILGTIFLIVSISSLIGNSFLVFFIIKNKQKVKKYELLEAEDQDALEKNNKNEAKIININPNLIEMQKLVKNRK